MNDFERMMLQQGVKKIEARPTQGTRQNASIIPSQTSIIKKTETDAPSKAFWVKGLEAKGVLESALLLLKEDRRNGHDAWGTAIGQTGTSVWLNTNGTVDEVLAWADRQNIRLIVLGGKGWTSVLHPAMGIATIEQDPK